MKLIGNVVITRLLVILAPTIAACGGVDVDEEYDEVQATASALSQNGSPSPEQLPATTARELMTVVMARVRADAINPPQASRIYGYTGLALYEAVVPGMKDYRSLGGQLNGLKKFPKPVGKDANDWPSAQAAAVATVASYLFTNSESRSEFAALAKSQLLARAAAGVSPARITASAAFGVTVGLAVIRYARSDGFAETRGRPYSPPEGEEFWAPTGSAPSTTLPAEPYWGTLRPFTLPSQDACAPDAPVPFSTDPESEFYQEANTVYQTSLTLTEEQEQIARFWADNAGATATPPGHWVSIETQLAETQSLATASEAYALVGIATADAFISVWNTKYTYNLLRPETYIRRYIDPAFTPLLSTPQFPEYTSGHSGSSGAASTVLTNLFGEVAFTDTTNSDVSEPRSFSSFDQAAEEAAVSRLYGGIHYPMGNIAGLAQGRCVGNFVIDVANTRR